MSKTIQKIQSFLSLRKPSNQDDEKFIPVIINSILKNKKIPIYGNGKQKRDFVYVEDAIEAVLLLMETDFSGPINLGSGKSISVKEICEILEKLSGKKIYDEK